MTTKTIAQSTHLDLCWQKHVGWHIVAQGNIMQCGIALDPAQRVLRSSTRVIRIECVCPDCLKWARGGKVGK